MSFTHSSTRRKNRNLNNSNSANYGSSTSKIDKQNRMKNLNDKSQASNRYEGVYSNPDFMFVNTSLIGTLARILHKDGNLYEGVLSTFSSDFEIVLNTVSKVVPKADTNTLSPNVGSLLASLIANNDFMDTVIFKLKDIVMMTISNVDLDFAVKGNFTDTEISKFNPSQLDKEKDLVPWDGCCTEDGLDSLNHDIMFNDDGDGGWDANDMFKLNEKKYNLSTTYTHSMEGYTVPLDKNAKDYEEREAEANRIAALIESDPTSKDRIAKEDGDEEDRFSAVVRPNDLSQPIHPQAPRDNNKQPTYNQNNNNNQSNSIPLNQQSHSRHDNLNNSRNRNKNPNTSGNLNTSGNYSSNNSLNRSKNQSSLNTSGGGSLQQSQSYHHFSSRSNGPMNNRLNSRLDHEDKEMHHNRNDRLMHNDQQMSQQSLPPQQRSSHNNSNNNSNSNNRRVNPPPQPTMQKREETTQDLKKFSSHFKMAINQQQQQQQQQQQSGNNQPINPDNNNKEVVNKELAKELKQLNINKPVDSSGKEQIVNNNEQTSTSNKSSINKDDEISQINNNKAVSKQPLIDKPPKEKSPPADKLSNNEQLTTDKVNSNKHQIKEHQPTKSVESPPQQQQDNIKQESRDNDSTIKQSSPETTISSQTSADSGKNSSSASNTELQNADKTLKKSSLNPNAKEFNPNANPYTPKFAPANNNSYPATVNPVNANLAPVMQPPPPQNAGVNQPQPHLAYQPNAHHLAGHPNAAIHGQPNTGAAIHSQMPISQLGTVQHAGNQQLITPVLHPTQQPLMAHHPTSAQVQMHQAPGAHQMIPFQPHLMSPIQFAVQTNPQNSIHHLHQNAHQTSPYIIPVSTANLPPNAAQLQNAANNQIAVNYQQTNQPPNANLVLNQQAPNQTVGGQSAGGNRSARNKPGHYHNQSGNVNQRSNQNNQQQPNANQPQQMTGNQPQPNIQNPHGHVLNSGSAAAIYSQQQAIHLQPNFNPNVNPGTYQIYHPQFSAHHNPRLMSPQSMVPHPSMAYASPADPAFQQIYSNYMTNMTGVPQFANHQFVAMSPSNTPASVSSPIPLNHGSNTMINNIGLQPVTAGGTPAHAGPNVQRTSTNGSATSNVATQVSTNSQQSQTTQLITTNGAVQYEGQYATGPQTMMSYIITQPSLHAVQAQNEQTPPASTN